nr:AAA family ATPase [Planctomycetota bacterium]
MRFLRLDLLAFGPFTKASLDFSAPGLHLIYGPNEAGKTTARRALRTALFGFRTKPVEFDFVHDKSALRVGLLIEDGKGTRSAFIRRRGNKNDLLDADGQTPLENDPISTLLAGVGLVGETRETHFERAFAIGEAELRLGGQEILAGKGDLSELLFMTAAGLPQLRAVERELTSAAEALFLPSGKKPPINDAILRWKTLQGAAQQKSLPPAEFVQHTEALRQATANRDRIEATLTELRRRQAKLERIRHAVHPAGRLREHEAELAGVADAPLLPEGFSENRRRIEAERQLVTVRLSGLDAEAEQIESRLAELQVPDDLLAAAQEIERLYKRLGSYEQTLADTPKRLAELAQFEADAKARLREVRPDLELGDAESLRLTRQEREAVYELAGRRRELLAARKTVDELRRKLLHEASAATDELDRLGPEPSAERLEAVYRSSERHGDPDPALAEAQAEAGRLLRQVIIASSGLSPWEGEVEDLARLPVPAASTFDRFETDFNGIAQETARLTERKAEAERALQSAEQALARLERDGDVPTEESLRAARERRDEIWSDVRSALDAPPSPSERDDRLSIRFEDASKAADDAADRLRREASRTQQLLNDSEERERQSEALEKIASAESDLRNRREALISEWNACWPFLPKGPRTPREMREWTVRWDALLRLSEQRQAANERAADFARRREAFRSEVVKAIT